MPENPRESSPASNDPVARFIERQNWMSPDTEAVQETVRTALDRLGPAVRGALHGDWLHEPLHAALTDVPVGSWTAAVAFDAIGAMTASEKLDGAADAVIILGLVGAAGAAITGLNDWAEVKREAPLRVGAVHAILNVAGTGLLLASSLCRRQKASRANARSLAILGYLVVSLSAHLGANLVYAHGIGVERGKAWQD